jgi:hypothetical protein
MAHTYRITDNQDTVGQGPFLERGTVVRLSLQ